MVDLADATEPELWDSIENDLKDVKTLSERLRDIYSEYILRMESIEYARILESSKKEGKFIQIASQPARMAYDRVSEIFDSLTLEENMKVVMVGCGQLPVTAIHFAEKSKVREIVCLDVVETAISSAEQIIQKLGLENIKFRLCSGTEYDFGDSDVIYVANMVRPKIDVMKQIVRTAKKRPQLILREPYGLGRMWADQCAPLLGDELGIKAYGPGSRYLSRDMHLEWKK